MPGLTGNDGLDGDHLLDPACREEPEPEIFEWQCQRCGARHRSTENERCDCEFDYRDEGPAA